MQIDAKDMDFTTLNTKIREAGAECEVKNCLGQRFIAAGSSGQTITIDGIPGNALGAYLAGTNILVNGNAQDAVGDTMNDGTITIHGNIGDAAGYAMRGGQIYIQGNAGYRAGIHMKAYKEKFPVIVIGGHAGSFLGEYQAGGLIVVLGLHEDGKPVVGNFPCTGMHGGKMFLRGSVDEIRFPDQTNAHEASMDELKEILPYLETYCKSFDYPLDKLMESTFTIITPDSKNPYKQMYVAN